MYQSQNKKKMNKIYTGKQLKHNSLIILEKKIYVIWNMYMSYTVRMFIDNAPSSDSVVVCKLEEQMLKYEHNNNKHL